MFPMETPKHSKSTKLLMRSSNVRFHQYRNLLEKKRPKDNKCSQIIKSFQKCCSNNSQSNEEEQSSRLGLLEELKNDNFGLHKMKANENLHSQSQSETPCKKLQTSKIDQLVGSKTSTKAKTFCSTVILSRLKTLENPKCNDSEEYMGGFTLQNDKSRWDHTKKAKKKKKINLSLIENKVDEENNKKPHDLKLGGKTK